MVSAMRKTAPLRAQLIGPIAAEILEPSGEADVVAVFERSAYVMCAGGLVCIGESSIGAGPINVVIARRVPSEPTPFGLHVGMKGVAGAGQLTLGDEVVIASADAAKWTPPPFPTTSAAKLKTGVDVISQLMPSRLPADGVASVLFAPASKAAKTPTGQAAKGSIADLQTALPTALASGVWSDAAIRAATLLIGLGPGLTPSGDDLLGGLMLALTARGHETLRDSLWTSISGELDDLTVPVSAMHLSAAADGMGAEAVHLLINVMLSGDTAAIPTHLASVLAIGATSGADTVAGIVMGLRA
jgi:hypothetical protein